MVSDDSLRDLLQLRVNQVEQRIRSACARAGRPRGEVQLVAVTKTLPDAILPLLPEFGLNLLAENRPQELWRKAALLAGRAEVTWHLIGHLQRNKAERTLPLVQLIHSVDSLRLLQTIDAIGAAQGTTSRVLLEVNASGEDSKQGFAPGQVPELVPALHSLRNVQVHGLMTMAALDADPPAVRACFASLRCLGDRLAAELQGIHPLRELSMGMSNDFEIAVEEGATLVRIGSALFEGLAG